MNLRDKNSAQFILLHKQHFDNRLIELLESLKLQEAKILSAAREGIDISESHLIEIGSLIRPLIKQGLSPYAILQSHPEIDISEKTIYTYIKDGTFKRAGVDLGPLDLRRQVSRKIKKKDKNHYKQRSKASFCWKRSLARRCSILRQRSY